MAQISEHAALKNEVDLLAERMGRLGARLREVTTTEQLREEFRLYWSDLVTGVDRVAKLTHEFEKGKR